jgi:transposase
MGRPQEVIMAMSKDAKNKALKQHGSLNPHAQSVRDELFCENEFFDPRDIVQVKYEMLRRVRVDGFSVTKAAATFGFSRPVFYQAQKAFEQSGLPGMVPRRPGPRHAHKLSEAVLQFIDQQRLKDKTLRAPALAKMVRQRFGISVHARSVERALLRRQKRG